MNSDLFLLQLVIQQSCIAVQQIILYCEYGDLITDISQIRIDRTGIFILMIQILDPVPAKKFLNARPVIILPHLFLAIKHMIGEISIHKFCI